MWEKIFLLPLSHTHKSHCCTFQLASTRVFNSPSAQSLIFTRTLSFPKASPNIFISFTPIHANKIKFKKKNKKKKRRRKEDTPEVEKKRNAEGERERERERERALSSALCGSVGALVSTATRGSSGPLSLA